MSCDIQKRSQLCWSAACWRMSAQGPESVGCIVVAFGGSRPSLSGQPSAGSPTASSFVPYQSVGLREVTSQTSSSCLPREILVFYVSWTDQRHRLKLAVASSSSVSRPPSLRAVESTTSLINAIHSRLLRYDIDSAVKSHDLDYLSQINSTQRTADTNSDDARLRSPYTSLIGLAGLSSRPLL